MAGDLYPLATNIELTRIQDYNSQARLIIKTEPTGRVRQEMYIRLGATHHMVDSKSGGTRHQ